jgi:ABC-type oligopeptide transport system substrate-binding subunit
MRWNLLVLLAALLLAGGCGSGIDNSRLRADIIEDPPRPISVAKMPLSSGSFYLRNATAQGLVTFDLQGRVIPALASRWIVTDDDLSYIFRLKKTRWNNGRELQSGEVVNVLRLRIAELRNSRFAPELSTVDDVVSMTGKVIEVRLKAPMPNLLELLAQPEFGLVNKGVGSGPMQAKRSGQAMSLQLRIEEADGTIAYDNATVSMRSTTGAEALARFATGKTDLVTNGRFEHAPLLTANDNFGVTPQLDPVPGLFGLMIMEAGPFLSAAANREAIASAIDRPRLLSAFAVGPWRESLTLAPETLRNRGEIARPSWTSLNMQARKAAARFTITRWEAENGAVRALRIAMPRGPGARVLFAFLKADMAAIGLEAQRVDAGQPADIRFVDRVADLSSPSWYLDQMSCLNTKLCSSNADRLVAEARLQSDPELRKQRLAEAEIELQSLRNFIPIANPLRWSVARDGLLGFAPNPRGIHPLQYLGRDPT